MRHVTLMLEYFHPWPNSAGFYVARDNGWFAELGIDLEIRTVDPGRGDSLAYLARSEVDFAVFPSNRLLVRREAGEPLVALAAVNQRGLETMRTTKRSGIRRLSDLAGRRIAFNPTPRGVAMVRALLASDGGDPDDFIPVDAGTRELDPGRDFEGVADATYGSYWAWDNLLSGSDPAEEVTWRVDDALDLRYHSYLLGSRSDGVAVEPGLIEDFLAVAGRGFALAAADHEIAARVYERITPYFPAHVIRRSIAEIAPTWFHDGRWGVIRPELLGPYAEWLHGNGILLDPQSWRTATLDGLPVPS